MFLKGCPLRCAWCHNPESQRAADELLFHRTRCIGCGVCDEACPYRDARRTLRDAALRRERCGGCSRCADACPTGAIERVGRDMTVGQVMEEVRGDVSYFRHSGGGVTLSGGEPMMQPEPLYLIAKAAKEKGMNVWCYTGFTLENLLKENRADRMKLLSVLDVLVDGPFLSHERSLDLLYCGSKNQRLIDVPATLAAGEIRLYVPPEW